MDRTVPRSRRIATAMIAGVLALMGVAAADSQARGRQAGPKVVDGRIGDWRGESPMIGGAQAVSGGEFIYQDFIYDDTGAAVAATAGNQGRGTTGGTDGTYRYPSNHARYRSNAADLFQFRTALFGNRVFFLAWLNTLARPDSTVVAVALGEAGAERLPWPLGAGLSTPGTRHVITLWGTGGSFDGKPIEDVGGEVAVNVEDNAIEASVPVALVGTRFRAYVGTGLWGVDGWMTVGLNRSDTAPGGGDGAHPNVFNVAFRSDEIGANGEPGWKDENFWFERMQAAALADSNIDRYFADIDLAAPDTPPPSPAGLQYRIYRSSVTVPPGEGFIEYGVNVYNDDPINAGRGRGCSLLTLPVPSCAAFDLAGPWQPYLVYVPPQYDRMMVFLHGGTYPYNYASLPSIQRELGDGLGALLVEPVALGPSSWFVDQAQLAVLESMRDAMARYPGIDPSRTTIGGISMGGFGTNRLLATNPDLFAGGVLWSAAVGDPSHNLGGGRYEEAYAPGHGDPVDIADNNRNHDLLIVHGIPDQSAHYPITLRFVRRLDEMGYRYELLSHPTWQHTSVMDADDWHRERAFLAPLRFDPNPRRVTYSTSEAWWRPDLSAHLVFDRAYWISGLRVRDTSQGFQSKGTVDAISLGRTETEPATAPFGPEYFSGPPAPYLRTGRGAAGPPAPAALSNAFTVTLINLRAARFDLARMGLTPEDALVINATTDGPVELTLAEAAGTCLAASSGPGEVRTRKAGGDLVVDLPGAGVFHVTLAFCKGPKPKEIA